MLNQRVFTPNISHKCSKAFPVRYLCRNGRKKILLHACRFLERFQTLK